MTVVLVAMAIGTWLVVAVVLTTMSPVDDAGAQLTGALTLGAAVGLTVWPLLWSTGRKADATTGLDGLATAGRRSGLVGLVISILVILRALEVVTLPVLVFLIATAVLVELALTLRQ